VAGGWIVGATSAEAITGIVHRVKLGKGSGPRGTYPLVEHPKPRLRPVPDDGTRDPVPSANCDAANPGSESPAADIAAALVERARAGDMQAWARLYQDHFDGLYRHLRYLTGECQAAEELVQETFVQALCCVARYDGRSRFSTWLHGIGLNVARHHWRAQRSTAKAHAKLIAVEQLREHGESPTREVLAKQRARALYDALEQLPTHLREAFILRELEGLSAEEAAEQLGITTNNLAVRASRARTRLRKQLGQGDGR
jgi:RNA polymerase sigma-70 factor, ECF subfamily